MIMKSVILFIGILFVVMQSSYYARGNNCPEENADTVVVETSVTDMLYNDLAVYPHNWYDIMKFYHKQCYSLYADADSTIVDNAPCYIIATTDTDTLEYIKNIPSENCDITYARIRSDRFSICGFKVGMSRETVYQRLGLSPDKNGRIIKVIISDRNKGNNTRQNDIPLTIAKQTDVWLYIDKGKIESIVVTNPDADI